MVNEFYFVFKFHLKKMFALGTRKKRMFKSVGFLRTESG